MTPAKIYPFSIPAGGSFPLLVLGDYCKILTSNGELSIAGDSFGTLGPILAGQGVEDTPFSRLVLVNNSGAMNSGTILIADNKFIDDRITGEVSVIDGGKSRVLANSAFMGADYVAASVGNFSITQLWNPVGSEKNVFIEQIFIGCSSNTGISISKHNAELTIAGTSQPISKNISGSAGIALIKNQTNVAYLGTVMGSISILASTTFQYKFTEPLLLNPGYGMMINPTNVNMDIRATFEFFEEVIL